MAPIEDVEGLFSIVSISPDYLVEKISLIHASDYPESIKEKAIKNINKILERF
jgi:hypothetical protein